MKYQRIWNTGLIGSAIFLATSLSQSVARAQEAEIVGAIGREIVESLGNDAAKFGGEAVAEETAERLAAEATKSVGREGSQIAKTQVERIVASRNETLVFDLKLISGKSLPLLADVSDASLPATISTLARPGVEEGIESLGTMALKKAALAGESRLPGAGLKVVEQFGDDGASIIADLGEDQANSLVGVMHVEHIKSLAHGERAKLFNALVSRPDATIGDFGGLTGPLVVVAAGLVIWHGADLTLGPDERVTKLPDGTVVSEKTGFVSKAITEVSMTAHELSAQIKWAGIVSAIVGGCVLELFVWRRENRRRTSAFDRGQSDVADG